MMFVPDRVRWKILMVGLALVGSLTGSAAGALAGTGAREAGSITAVDYASVQSGSERFWLPDSLDTPWTASDKKLHFLACYSIVLTGRIGSDETGPGVMAASALSLGKEFWDLWFKDPESHRGVSKRDLVADALGIAAAILIVECFAE
jgi:hypothetical protein